MRRRARPGGRPWWRHPGVLAACLLAMVGVASTGLLVVRPEVGTVPRRVVKQLDHALLGGLLQRIALDDPPTRPEHLEVPAPRPGAYDWWGGRRFLAIAHALGPSMEGGRNTLATLREGWERGFRTFEVDLALTADSVLACYHGTVEEDLAALTWPAVRSRRPDACRFEDLVAWAEAHADARFVVDVKTGFDDAYRRMARIAGEAGVAGAFIPQVYHYSQVRWFRESDGFGGLIFTAYRSALSLEDVFEFARRAGVEVVTVPAANLGRWRGTLPERPKVLAHPVNDPFRAAALRDRGVDGIYTSYVAPRTAPALFGDASAP